jgi:hypothetical protein
VTSGAVFSFSGRVAYVTLSVAVLLTAGCGNPHGVVSVTGIVTVDGQKPPGPGKIMFTPRKAADGFPTRPAIAPFDTDGRYRVRSFPKHEGIIPGQYQVAVECWETPPNLEGKPVRSYIAAKHQSPTTSGLELTVEADSKPVEFDIALTSR